MIPVPRPRALTGILGVLLIAAMSVLALPASPVHAADGPVHAADGEVTWSVQPSTPSGPDGRTELSYQVAPGSTITDWVAVTNSGDVPATFRVYAADATTDYDSAAFTLIGADQASTGAGSWTQVDTGPAVCDDTGDAAEAACAAGLGVSVTVEPGSRVDLPVTITVPHDATPGDHSAGIVASLLSEGAAEGATVRREDRVGTRVYLRVDGPLSPGLGVAGVVAGYDGSWNPFGGGTARVGFDLQNLGNTRISAAPEIRLTGPFGIDLGTITASPVSNLLPGSTGHVAATLDGVPPLLLLFADVTVTAVPADGVAAGDPLPAAVTSSVVAWAVPWLLLGVVVAAAVVIWLLVRVRRRSRQRLAEELAHYADAVRAEALTESSRPRSESEPVR